VLRFMIARSDVQFKETLPNIVWEYPFGGRSITLEKSEKPGRLVTQNVCVCVCASKSKRKSDTANKGNDTE